MSGLVTRRPSCRKSLTKPHAEFASGSKIFDGRPLLPVHVMLHGEGPDVDVMVVTKTHCIWARKALTEPHTHTHIVLDVPLSPVARGGQP